jgi:hypothetical protein
MTKQNEPNPAEKNSVGENQMIYPSCSECVFRLGGDFEEIRTQMYNIINWTRKEYDGTVDGSKRPLSEEIKKSIADVKKKIKEAKTLEDFEKIVIEFTCNYETFFKVDEDGERLLVATCNNYNWDDVEKQDVWEDDIEYWGVAGVTSYILHDVIDGYPIFKLQYIDEYHKKFPTFIFADKGQTFFDEEIKAIADEKKPVAKGKDTKFVIRDKIMYKMEDNHLTKANEISDKTLLNKVKILANLGGL